MKVKKLFLLMFVMALFLCVNRLYSAVRTPVQPQEAAAPVLSSVAPEGQTLFPELDPAIVTAVSITTPQSAFDMRRGENKSVSINGQRGDEDVFSTMLAHIADMDFVSTHPFITPEIPMLTLVIHQRGEEFTAAFYADDENGEHARIIAGWEHAPVYGLIDGWRVGTLMLACEGTRIQDAHGKETPAEP